MGQSLEGRPLPGGAPYRSPALREAAFITASSPGARQGSLFRFTFLRLLLGYFGRGNLILCSVYFSTLENSQCCTESEAAPSLLSPLSVFPQRLRTMGTAHSGLGPERVP